MEEKMKTIDAIDEELADLEDMVDQLDQYTGDLRTSASCCLLPAACFLLLHGASGR